MIKDIDTNEFMYAITERTEDGRFKIVSLKHEEKIITLTALHLTPLMSYVFDGLIGEPRENKFQLVKYKKIEVIEEH